LLLKGAKGGKKEEKRDRKEKRKGKREEKGKGEDKIRGREASPSFTFFVTPLSVNVDGLSGVKTQLT